MKFGSIMIFLYVIICFQIGCKNQQKSNSGIGGTITVSGAWALYPMMVKWAEEFKNINPSVRIDISAGGAGKGMADALADLVDIGMISREIQAIEIEKGAWYIAVVKDAVVGTISEKCPAWEILKKQGLTPSECIKIWITREITDWNQIINSKQSNVPIHVYTRSDACGAAETWAKFLGKNQEDLAGIGVYGDPGVAEAIRKDELGIGYNNINYAYDPSTKKPFAGIRILPIDLNENNQIDTEENFYSNRDSLVQAINRGVYPSPPARNLYLVCHGKPQKEIIVLFLKWILTDGQKFVSEAGYIQLPEEKIKSVLD